MPTILSHAIVPLALGVGLGKNIISRRLLLAGVVASIAPDFDVVAFRFGIAYAHEFGHRGASHSIACAVALGLLALLFAPQLRAGRVAAFAFVGISTLSHGLLDTFTNGGLGVALYWPWSELRLFARWQPIEVSPIGWRFVSARGIAVLRSELLWIWLPALSVGSLLVMLRRMRARNSLL